MSSHVVYRAKERYGLTLTAEDIQHFTQQILEGTAKPDPTGIPEVWIVNVAGRKIPVIFNENSCSIRTVLPRNYQGKRLAPHSDCQDKRNPDRTAQVAFRQKKAAIEQKWFFEEA